MAARHDFRLQFPPSEIRALAARYAYQTDEPALAAGRAIAAGERTRAHLMVIVKWKSPRPSSRVSANTDSEIEDALRLAWEAKTERAAIGVLTGLDGVDVRMASAILTAMMPQRYTILDIRALQALGVSTDRYGLGLYLDYLAHCRQIAAAQGLGLRELDRALWQWSKELGAR